MRHRKIAASGRLDMADIAAVWPASAQIAPIPIPEVEPAAWETPALHAPDPPLVSAGVRSFLIAGSAALAAAFAAGAVSGIL